MMQPPDWNDYHAFLAIARAGQLARAAQAMGVDATTMGRRLRRLETRIGATLFEQTREGQVLTEAGEAMLVEVEAMERAASRIPSSCFTPAFTRLYCRFPDDATIRRQQTDKARRGAGADSSRRRRR